MFAMQFFLTESQKAAKGSINKEGLPIQVFDRDSYRTRVENV